MFAKNEYESLLKPYLVTGRVSVAKRVVKEKDRATKESIVINH